MVRSIEDGRWYATFRPRKRVRFLATGALAAWFGVWSLGEIYAVGIVLASLGVPGGAALLNSLGLLGGRLVPALADRIAWREFPSPSTAGPLALSFLASWLAIWTLAGLMAAWQFLRLHAGEDRLEWDDSSVTLRRRVGPFRFRRSWPADRIEHVSLSRSDRALLIHTARSTRILTEWGSKAERSAVRDEVRQVLGLPNTEEKPSRAERKAAKTSRDATRRDRARAAGGRKPVLTLVKGAGGAPPGWAATTLADGGTRLRRDPGARRARAIASWCATVAFAAGAAFAYRGGYLDMFWGAGEGVLAACVLITGLLVVPSAWLTFGGSDIVVRDGGLEVRGGFMGFRSVRKLEHVRLSVEHTTDSDGDDWFELQARSGLERLTLDLGMNESAPVIELARWIAAKSRAPLEMGRGVQDAHDLSLAA